MVEQGVLPEPSSEEIVQERLSNFYIELELARVSYSLKIGWIRRNPNVTSPQSIVIVDDMARKEEDILDGYVDKLQELATAKILFPIEDSSIRTGIKTNALIAARNFWEETLLQPDNAYNTIVLGERRIEEISSKIKGLTDPNKDQ
ncbi:hypothetical protein HYT32_01730 [Candidatus Roizmanbacteria bacterium]|nr:hypothetical protein [Candidatus Roizmanbacteria bacterium]